jgi:hypothetical protein
MKIIEVIYCHCYQLENDHCCAGVKKLSEHRLSMLSML